MEHKLRPEVFNYSTAFWETERNKKLSKIVNFSKTVTITRSRYYTANINSRSSKHKKSKDNINDFNSYYNYHYFHWSKIS